MNVKLIKATAAGYEFELQIRAEKVLFSVLKNFKVTGHVTAFSSDFWPGNVHTFFEAYPIEDESRHNPELVRLTGFGIDKCSAAMEMPAEIEHDKQHCTCGLCQENEMVAA